MVRTPTSVELVELQPLIRAKAPAKIVARRDGAQQATYKGVPLYQYAGDEADKDANGQGLDMFGGEWHVLTKDGQPLA